MMNLFEDESFLHNKRNPKKQFSQIAKNDVSLANFFSKIKKELQARKKRKGGFEEVSEVAFVSSASIRELRKKFMTSNEKTLFGTAIIQNGTIKFIDSNLTKILGYSSEEMIKSQFIKYIPHNYLPDLAYVYKRWISGKEVPSAFMTKLKTNVGILLDVEISVTKINFEDKPADLVIVRDISEQLRIYAALKSSEEKYRKLVELANDGIMIIQDNLLKYVNPSLAKMIGYNLDEILEMPFMEFVPYNVLPEVVDHYMEFSDCKNIPNIYNTELERKDGKIIDVELNTARITYQEKPSILIVVRDITERKQAEAKLYQVKLEEERYHAMLSHFINNYLQKIVNQLDLLSFVHKNGQTLDEEAINQIGKIALCASKTIEDVNTIFEVLQSPFDQQSQKKGLNLLLVLEEVLSCLQLSQTFSCPVLIDKKNLNIDLTTGKYLKQVFSEIFSFVLDPNKNSPIIIEGFEDNSHFNVVIRDSNSEPIPIESCAKLSGKITDEWESQGHYIGLSLASVIMQHFGGEMKIKPLENKGNEFHLSFPLTLCQKR